MSESIDGTRQSLYTLVCERFGRDRPSPLELREQLQGGGRYPATLFALGEAMLVGVARYLGLDENQLAIASGWDMAHPHERSLLMAADLRYCPECLRLGTHSAVHQHRAVADCPHHLLALKQGCPACGKPIKLSLLALARSPFCCDSCGVLFRRRRPGDAADQALDRHAGECVLSLCKGLKVDDRTSRSNIFRWGRKGLRLLTDGSMSQAVVAAHCRWQEGFDTTPRSWRTRRVTVEGEAPAGFADVRAVVVDVLTRLASHVGIDLDQHALNPLLLKESGLSARIDRNMSLTAAAFWKVALLYRVADCLLRSPRADWRAISSFGAFPSDSAAASREVLKAEVNSLLICVLMDMLRSRFTAEIDWRRPPAPWRFCPAWQTSKSGTRVLLELRSLGGWERTGQLFIRFKNRMLLQAPSEQALSECCASGA